MEERILRHGKKKREIKMAEESQAKRGENSESNDKMVCAGSSIQKIRIDEGEISQISKINQNQLKQHNLHIASSFYKKRGQYENKKKEDSRQNVKRKWKRREERKKKSLQSDRLKH